MTKVKPPAGARSFRRDQRLASPASSGGPGALAAGLIAQRRTTRRSPATDAWLGAASDQSRRAGPAIGPVSGLRGSIVMMEPSRSDDGSRRDWTDRRWTTTSSRTAQDDEPAMTPPTSLGRRRPAGTRRVDDEWRRWIAENLMVGQSPESILEAMTSSGFAPDESAREIDAAVQSPYLKGSELLLNRLKKRDWLLAVYRKMQPPASRVRRDRAPAQAVARRVPPRVLLDQSAGHHHRHDG